MPVSLPARVLGGGRLVAPAAGEPRAGDPAPASGHLARPPAVLRVLPQVLGRLSCSVHDAVTAEKAGVIATAIITDRFVPTGRAMAQVSGRPDFPLAVIPHPISNNDDAVLRAKATAALQQCVAIALQT